MLVVNLRITNLCKFPDMNVMERAKRIQVYISLWLFWIVGRSYLEYVEDFMYKSTNRELSSSWNTFSATSLECLVKTNCFLLKAWSLYCLAFYKQVASYLFRFASIPKSGNGLCVGRSGDCAGRRGDRPSREPWCSCLRRLCELMKNSVLGGLFTLGKNGFKAIYKCPWEAGILAMSHC